MRRTFSSADLGKVGEFVVGSKIGGRMKQLYATGTPVVVEMSDGAEYSGQVVFAHFGDVPRVFVAWWTDAPVGCHPVADWVHADRVRCVDHGALAR